MVAFALVITTYGDATAPTDDWVVQNSGNLTARVLVMYRGVTCQPPAAETPAGVLSA